MLPRWPPPLRAAVVGCGGIGAGGPPAHPDVGTPSHAAAYRAHPRTELVAVCDTDPRRVREVADREGCTARTDLRHLLEEDEPDVISVATPDGTHADVVARCLLAPSTRAVLAEKPLATTAADAAALRDLAAERGVLLLVGYTRRFAPGIAALRPLVDELGGVRSVSGVYVKGLVHNGTHWLDLLRMLVGDPVSVSGRDVLREGGPDPTLDAGLTFADGTAAALVGLSAARYTAFEMDLLLAGGRIRVEESGHVVRTWDVGDDPRHPGYRVLRERSRRTGVLRDALLHAVDDVVRGLDDEGHRPRCTAQDGVRALQLAERVRSSAAAGGDELPC